MQSSATPPQAYLDELEPERRAAVGMLREAILENLPPGFAEVMNHGMLGYVVPHSLYAPGYHCNPKQPLPFMNLASQKNNLAVYHMGIYSDATLLAWFKAAWADQVSYKLDMGKSCIRLKKLDQLPVGLIGALASKMTPQDWIKQYEAAIKP